MAVKKKTDAISRADFFRQEAHAYVQKRIGKGESFVITGMPGVGMSSLLRVISHRLETNSQIPNRYIDLNETTAPIDENLLEIIGQSLRDKIEDDKSKPEYLKTIRGRGFQLELS